MTAEVRVYRGGTLINTFPDHESATWFIQAEFSAEEADILGVRVVEVETQEKQSHHLTKEST